MSWMVKWNKCWNAGDDDEECFCISTSLFCGKRGHVLFQADRNPQMCVHVHVCVRVCLCATPSPSLIDYLNVDKRAQIH